ncbi:type II toxin-antitoxin system RelE/ParE family toxin [Edwardsiella tarda]|uniref:type II toxin-antitoxin system RelE/ParE family toxin n=1 Tax=Edwardsiella tarda TaxID=636 RepID=UPI00351C86E8
MMKILCFPAAEGEAAPMVHFLGQLSGKLAESIKKKLIAFSTQETIYSSSSLKILKPTIWGYKGTIYKLRVDCGAQSARVLFTLSRSNDLVVLHAFLKKTRKTPPKEAEIAIRHLAALNVGADPVPLFPHDT